MDFHINIDFTSCPEDGANVILDGRLIGSYAREGSGFRVTANPLPLMPDSEEKVVPNLETLATSPQQAILIILKDLFDNPLDDLMDALIENKKWG